MIQLTRIQKPTILVQNAENWTIEYLEAKEIYNISKTPENKKTVHLWTKSFRSIDPN